MWRTTSVEDFETDSSLPRISSAKDFGRDSSLPRLSASSSTGLAASRATGAATYIGKLRSDFTSPQKTAFRAYLANSRVAKLNMSVSMLRGVMHVPLVHHCATIVSHHQGGKQAENLNIEVCVKFISEAF